MAIGRANDPRAFRDFLENRLTQQVGEGPTLDDLLDLWAFENATEAEQAETCRAIQQGLDDWSAGRTRPFEEFDRAFREQHGLPPRR